MRGTMAVERGSDVPPESTAGGGGVPRRVGRVRRPLAFTGSNRVGGVDVDDAGAALVVTPVLHGFQTVENTERRRGETNDLLKNAVTAVESLMILVPAGMMWPYPLNLDF